MVKNVYLQSNSSSLAGCTSRLLLGIFLNVYLNCLSLLIAQFLCYVLSERLLPHPSLL